MIPWNISQIITKTVPIRTRTVLSYAMKWSIPLWVWRKVNGNWENNMIRISQWKESHCRTNTSVRRKKSKRADLWESSSGMWATNLNIWVRSLVKKNYSRVPLWWTLKSPMINTLADGLIKRTSSVLDEMESKTMHKDAEADQ